MGDIDRFERSVRFKFFRSVRFKFFLETEKEQKNKKSKGQGQAPPYCFPRISPGLSKSGVEWVSLRLHRVQWTKKLGTPCSKCELGPGPFLFCRSGGSGLHRTPHTAAGRDWRRCRDPTPSQGAKAAHDHISAGWCTAGEGTTVPKHGGGLAASAELQTVSGGVTFVVWRCCGLPIPRRCWGRVPSHSHRGLQKHRRRWRPLR